MHKPFLVVLLVTMYLSACGTSSVQNDVENGDIKFSSPDEPFYFTGTIEEMIDEDSAIVLASLVEKNPEGLVFVNLSIN